LEINLADRYLGCLLGLATGDALGASLEFYPPGTFTPLTDMVGGGFFHLKPGQWTDDTSMALCLAESLAWRKGFDPMDQLARYWRWYQEGYWSSTGTSFDIGGTVRDALLRFNRTRQPYCGSIDPLSAGNGSIMRLAPVPMAYARHSEKAIELSAQSSRTTHAAVEAVDACRYLCGLIVGALQGASKEKLMAEPYTPYPDCWEAQPLSPKIYEIALGSYKRRQPPEIQGSGYVVKSLEAALWAFCRSHTFADGCLEAVNLGDDADTTAAVYGQLAGAFYGVGSIPSRWRELLARREEIEALALKLLDLAGRVD